MAHRRRSSFVAAALALAVLIVSAGDRPAAQSSPLAVITADVLAALVRAPGKPVRLMVQGNVTLVRQAVTELGLTPQRVLDEYVVVDATAVQVAVLRLNPAVRLIAGDLRVAPLMVVSDRAMGADQVRAGTGGALGLGLPGVNGQGIGVAVVDSGIAAHAALAGKVTAAVSFVPGEPSVGDGFGHGTHIAGIIAGRPTPGAGPAAGYAGGIAPGAHLVNVRVLGSDGSGLTSSVIAGLDWVLANRVRYGIRVVNLSLGHPATGPCVIDPLCSTIERVTRTGLVVVVSAGNRGATPSGQLVLGTITSPGTSPFALTVGATNTWNTVARGDDTVASYSSRGPAAFDLLVKPDVVAPGNKIVSLEADGSYLATHYPGLHVAGGGTNGYRKMSGTSMSAGMVSGGVALLLQASPLATPLQVRLALQLTATPMGEGLMAAGAGSVNLWSARQLMGNQLTLTLTRALPTSTIDGAVVRAGGLAWWDGGRLMQRLQAGTGVGVISLRDALLGLLDPSRLGANTLYLVQGAQPLTAPAQILWGEGVLAPAGQQILWGEQLFGADGQQILWGDQILWGEQILWGDQILWGEQILWGDQILWGEQSTHGEQILWGESLPEGGAR
jgi:serine protease AprX